MAKFDSQYPEQLHPEGDDVFLIASSEDGSIMTLRYKTIMEELARRVEPDLMTDAEHIAALADLSSRLDAIGTNESSGNSGNAENDSANHEYNGGGEGQEGIPTNLHDFGDEGPGDHGRS